MRSRFAGPIVPTLLAFLLPTAAQCAAGPVDDQLLAIPDGSRVVLVIARDGAAGVDEKTAYLPVDGRYPGSGDIAAMVSGTYRGLRLDVAVSKSSTEAFLKDLIDAGLALRICSGFGSCARAVQGECKRTGSRAATFDLSCLDKACEGACENGTKIIQACVGAFSPAE